jgi:quercetin dioxygenase-like cupin family protein
MNTKLIYLIVGAVIGAGTVLIFDKLNQSNKIRFEELPKPYYNVLFENNNVRIVEHKLNPGEDEPMHNHPPMFAYFLEDAELIVKVPDVDPEKVTLNKGQTKELPALVHSIDNQGNTTLHSILVEFRE